MATNETPTNPESARVTSTANSLRQPGTVLLIVLAALVLFGAGIAAGHFGARRHLAQQPFGAGMHRMGMRGGTGYGMKGSATANESRLQGVVTQAGDGSFTIAGGGTTNTVQINDKTQYTGGTKVAVNDSVVVFGTTNNGAFTASRVVINP